jgi:hypothetical protein
VGIQNIACPQQPNPPHFVHFTDPVCNAA